MKQIIICYSLCSFCSHLGLSCLENLVTGSYCWIGFKQSTGRGFFIGSAERNRSRPFVFALQIYQSRITCYVWDRQGFQTASKLMLTPPLKVDHIWWAAILENCSAMALQLSGCNVFFHGQEKVPFLALHLLKGAVMKFNKIQTVGTATKLSKT